MARASLIAVFPSQLAPAYPLSVVDGVTYMAGAVEAKPAAHAACGYPLVDA